MELDDIRRQALAAREFPVVIEHATRVITCTLRIPTRHETRVALQRAGPADDAARLLVAERLLLEGALVAWSGVRVCDVLAEHDPADLQMPFDRGAVPLLLDAQPAWASALGLQLVDRMAQRNAAQDTATKN